MEAHWSNDSMSLFTAVVYYKIKHDDLKHLSYVIVSDELHHDKASVHMSNNNQLNCHFADSIILVMEQDCNLKNKLSFTTPMI